MEIHHNYPPLDLNNTDLDPELPPAKRLKSQQPLTYDSEDSFSFEPSVNFSEDIREEEEDEEDQGSDFHKFLEYE